MANYIRNRVQGGAYFFTVALADRRSDLLAQNIALLRDAYIATQRELPFSADAFVILPDHLHAIWTLPRGDTDYSERWRRIKARFSRQLQPDPRRSPSKTAKREKGVWQRRFWEHTIRDGTDFDRHMAYCWWNPVKHGLVDHPLDWPFSSLHRDVARGGVSTEWIGRSRAAGMVGRVGRVGVGR